LCIPYGESFLLNFIATILSPLRGMTLQLRSLITYPPFNHSHTFSPMYCL
jgi:hypothetical protein